MSDTATDSASATASATQEEHTPKRAKRAQQVRSPATAKAKGRDTAVSARRSSKAKSKAPAQQTTHKETGAAAFTTPTMTAGAVARTEGGREAQTRPARRKDRVDKSTEKRKRKTTKAAKEARKRKETRKGKEKKAKEKKERVSRKQQQQQQQHGAVASDSREPSRSSQVRRRQDVSPAMLTAHAQSIEHMFAQGRPLTDIVKAFCEITGVSRSDAFSAIDRHCGDFAAAMRFIITGATDGMWDPVDDKWLLSANVAEVAIAKEKYGEAMCIRRFQFLYPDRDAGEAPPADGDGDGDGDGGAAAMQS
ncbi:hypothetical protein PTSG_01319 [Salpingoeca rosetta]|uniref:Uncharacterized protein n=1 Tax=Salpingoeca rosetta (strain ATCC 50818 / BSB-021) TaxID=946362 RepID=F2U001_SALR5|nr:uncharacterized protein PTSG_01319 [Salpingoeca rosetta]EGD80729.1 hypothetical protein PTSG_01319 [Salpingoeca rosetta]|eukprot:XP_004997290.1 hypothetical protein PTSG_01319 [Salpingoeca rosetta]